MSLKGHDDLPKYSFCVGEYTTGFDKVKESLKRDMDAFMYASLYLAFSVSRFQMWIS